MIEDEARGGGDLPARILGAAKRGMGVRRLRHFRIAIGFAEAMEIEAPDMESGLAQFIAPGSSVEAMRDREA
jgi:hypothetical protein